MSFDEHQPLARRAAKTVTNLPDDYRQFRHQTTKFSGWSLADVNRRFAQVSRDNFARTNTRNAQNYVDKYDSQVVLPIYSDPRNIAWTNVYRSFARTIQNSDVAFSNATFSVGIPLMLVATGYPTMATWYALAQGVYAAADFVQNFLLRKEQYLPEEAWLVGGKLKDVGTRGDPQ